MARPGALLDIDGTLLDTNHLHALAWWRALRSEGLTFPLQRIHGLIGMGGDKLVAELTDDPPEGIDDRWSEQFEQLFDEVTVLPGARELVEALDDAGLAVVLASSAPASHLGRFRSILDVDDHLLGATSADDVDASKPDPDIFDAAIDRFDLDRSGTIAIGDTVWDARAAKRARILFAAVLTGGADADVLRREGAIKVYDDAAALTDDLEAGPLSPILALARSDGQP